MSNFNYNINIPAANNNPSNDQGLMFTNTNSIFNWAAIDHHGFGDDLGGYHAVIHQDVGTPARSVNRTAATGPVNFPGAIAGINQLFAASVVSPSSTDTQLFSITGNGGVSQLTGNLASNEGYVWCAGVLIQWGNVSFPPTSNNVVFADPDRTNCIQFPNGLFNIITGFTGTSTSTNNTLLITTQSLTGFSWARTTTNGAYTGFYWVAIGN